MKIAPLIVFLYLMVTLPGACRKESCELPAPTIDGGWKCLSCVNPDQTWNFNTGTATQKYYAVGSTVFTNTFHYWQKADTINFVNLSTNTVSAWKVRFVGSGVCEVVSIGSMMQPIQLLERE